MIMVKHNPVNRMPKPPPPVPPRPNKTLIAEALAKTRKPFSSSNTATPVRAAPPPPVNKTEDLISKSKSTTGVDVILKIPDSYERSLSEEIKANSRTVVFQSSNLKSNKDVSRKDSDTRKERVEVKKVSSFSVKDPPLLTARKLQTSDSGVKGIVPEENGVIKINTYTANSSKRLSCPASEKIDLGNEKHSFINNLKKSNSFVTKTKITNTVQSSSPITKIECKEENEKPSKCPEDNNNYPNNCDSDLSKDGSDDNWNEMLNDRNHVNTLIDEMFASVLEVSEETSKSELTTNSADLIKSEIVISNDQNKITISSNSLSGSDTCSVISSSSDNMSSTATVLVVNGGDNRSKENIHNDDYKDHKESSDVSNASTAERKRVKFDDKMNHEQLISEMLDMKKEQERIMKRQRKPSMNIFDNCDKTTPKIQQSDWVEINDGEEVKLTGCQITIEDLHKKEKDNVGDEVTLDYESLIAMSSLHGLPPLPKSLSGFALLENHGLNPSTPVRTSSNRSANIGSHLVYPPHPKHSVNGTEPINAGLVKKPAATTLDAQLAILKREMYSLRQLDLSLLSQLWSLNESIQDFRQMLQEQDHVLSPPSPSPTPSSADEGDTDEFYMSASSINFRPIAPPIPTRRPSASSNASSLG